MPVLAGPQKPEVEGLFAQRPPLKLVVEHLQSMAGQAKFRGHEDL